MSDSEANIVAVNLFCGVGGLTYGLKQAGLHVEAGYDFDPDCEYAYTANCETPFFQRDVSTLDAADVKQHLRNADFSVLAGCAPCQPFSTYSRTRVSNDDRWQLLESFARLAGEVRPDFLTMENVPQLARHAIFEEFVGVLEGFGYQVWWDLVSAEEFGVPQTRQRLVLLASIHSMPSLSMSRAKRRTVRDVIAQLPRLKAGEVSQSDPLHRACPLSDLNMRRIKATVQGVG